MFSLVKNFFILIAFSFISSCHEKDYDIIAEAKNFIMKDRNTENSEKSKISPLRAFYGCIHWVLVFGPNFYSKF